MPSTDHSETNAIVPTIASVDVGAATSQLGKVSNRGQGQGKYLQSRLRLHRVEPARPFFSFSYWDQADK